MATQPKPVTPRAAWRPKEYSVALHCSLATVWHLIGTDPDLVTVRIGGMRLITISPPDYVAKKAAQQSQSTEERPTRFGQPGSGRSVAMKARWAARKAEADPPEAA
jgi:hypothetical protein